MKFKVFSGQNLDKLEERVNIWLRDEKAEVVQSGFRVIERTFPGSRNLAVYYIHVFYKVEELKS